MKFNILDNFDGKDEFKLLFRELMYLWGAYYQIGSIYSYTQDYIHDRSTLENLDYQGLNEALMEIVQGTYELKLEDINSISVESTMLSSLISSPEDKEIRTKLEAIGEILMEILDVIENEIIIISLGIFSVVNKDNERSFETLKGIH